MIDIYLRPNFCNLSSAMVTPSTSETFTNRIKSNRQSINQSFFALQLSVRERGMVNVKETTK